jgi:hypothetical protein
MTDTLSDFDPEEGIDISNMDNVDGLEDLDRLHFKVDETELDLDGLEIDTFARGPPAFPEHLWMEP